MRFNANDFHPSRPTVQAHASSLVCLCIGHSNVCPLVFSARGITVTCGGAFIHKARNSTISTRAAISAPWVILEQAVFIIELPSKIKSGGVSPPSAGTVGSVPIENLAGDGAGAEGISMTCAYRFLQNRESKASPTTTRNVTDDVIVDICNVERARGTVRR